MNNEEERDNLIDNDGIEMPISNSSSSSSKISPGKVVNESGQVADSSTKKFTKTVGRGVAAYFTKGESLKYDKMVTENPVGDKLLGVVSDTLESNPGIKAVSDTLDEVGMLDQAENVLSAGGAILNGDIQGTVENAEKILEQAPEVKKKTNKKMAKILVSVLVPLGFILLLCLIICGPVLGGFLDLTEGDDEEIVDPSGNNPSTPDLSGLVSDEDIKAILAEIEATYGTLSDDRKAILTAALSILGSKYNYGGHPTGPGITGVPHTGLDCAGFVQWAYWTGLNENPGYLTTQAISSLIGSKFVEVPYEELLPGDIALKFNGYDPNRNNHTGIFAGNGKWIHAKGKNYGIVYGSYTGFTIYLRYTGIQ